MNPTLVVRADASKALGWGHISRTIALAEILHKEGWRIEYVAVDAPEALKQTIKAHGFMIFNSPLRQGSDLAIVKKRIHNAQRSGNACAVLIDNYEINSLWESQIRSDRVAVIVIDDLLNRSHCCDLLIDAGIDTSTLDYKKLVPEDCTLLCGSKYAILRSEFSEHRQMSIAKKTNFDHLKTIVISFGGSDPDDHTKHALSTIIKAQIPNIRVTVLVGQSYPHLEKLSSIAQKSDCIVLQNAKNVAEIFSQSDVAIGAGGISSLERCTLGLPSLITVIAQNQERSVHALINNSAAFYFAPKDSASLVYGLLKLMNVDTYKSVSDQASRLVDGLGCKRVAVAINKLVRE